MAPTLQSMLFKRRSGGCTSSNGGSRTAFSTTSTCRPPRTFGGSSTPTWYKPYMWSSSDPAPAPEPLTPTPKAADSSLNKSLLKSERMAVGSPHGAHTHRGNRQDEILLHSVGIDHDWSHDRPRCDARCRKLIAGVFGGIAAILLLIILIILCFRRCRRSKKMPKSTREAENHEGEAIQARGIAFEMFDPTVDSMQGQKQNGGSDWTSKPLSYTTSEGGNSAQSCVPTLGAISNVTPFFVERYPGIHVFEEGEAFANSLLFGDSCHRPRKNEGSLQAATEDSLDTAGSSSSPTPTFDLPVKFDSPRAENGPHPDSICGSSASNSRESDRDEQCDVCQSLQGIPEEGTGASIDNSNDTSDENERIQTRVDGIRSLSLQSTSGGMTSYLFELEDSGAVSEC